MFIVGEPMKPATKRLAGSVVDGLGVGELLYHPVAITAILVPSVIASIWSWVT